MNLIEDTEFTISPFSLRYLLCYSSVYVEEAERLTHGLFGEHSSQYWRVSECVMM